jgi:hypothetical protein
LTFPNRTRRNLGNKNLSNNLRLPPWGETNRQAMVRYWL